MATTPEYFYTPIFGVEDYAANGVPQSSQFGGGAKESHDNLIVSMWGNLDGEEFAPDEGELLKPSTEFGDFGSTVFGTSAFKNLVTAGSGKQFPSRNSAKFHLNAGISKSLSPPLLVVLDPPAAMKQRLAGAIASVEGAANPEGWIVDFAKSVTDIFDWRVQAEGSSGFEGRNTSAPGGIFTFYGGVASELPLLKTNGADGNFPQFYASVQTSVPTTVGALRELKAALDSGEFYVPLFFFPDESAMDISIEYPHSSGRN